MSITATNLTEWDLMPHRQAFESRVKRGSGCWRWVAGRRNVGRNGGVFTVCIAGSRKRAKVPAHRAALFYFTGRLPKPGEEVAHTCGNELCCNPEHLEVRKHETRDAG